MKKRWMVGAVVAVVAALFVLTPKVWVRATTSDFRIEGTTLVEYTGTANTVSVPANVETIGRSAFENNKIIKKVTIPDSVTKIEEYAFWGCNNLETVVLGDGLWEISDFTFTACESLRRVHIPDNIRRIGIMSFADCTGLQDIAIPISVTDIHETAFDGITSLQIHAEELSYPYKYALARGQNATNAPMPTDTPRPIVTPVPTPNVKPTPEPTNQPIGEVIGSTSIVGNDAFIIVNNRELPVGDGKDVDVEKLFRQEENIRIDDWKYYGDGTLHDLKLKEGTVEIGSLAFARSSLRRIVLPQGLTTIDYAAFYHCDNLKEVVIPDTVTHIDTKAFAFTPWLTDFYEGNSSVEGDFLIVGDGILLAYRGQEDTIFIPEGVKYIAPDAFLGLEDYNKIEYPDSFIQSGEWD